MIDVQFGKVNEEDLLEYVTSNNIEIAIEAARSLYATEPILDIAAHDKDWEVRMAAVQNPNIGCKSLEYLLKDSNEEIARLAKEKLGERK